MVQKDGRWERIWMILFLDYEFLSIYLLIYLCVYAIRIIVYLILFLFKIFNYSWNSIFFLLASGISCSVRHLCNSWRDLPDTFSTYLAPYTVTAVSLTTFPVPCFQIPGLSTWLPPSDSSQWACVQAVGIAFALTF